MEDFSRLDAIENAAVNVQKADDGKKAQLEELKELFKQTLASDPTFTERLNIWSEKVAVVNTLGFGEGGNLVAKEPVPGEDGEGKRILVPTSKIVGYLVQNVGDVPIPYVTEEFEKNSEGIWVGRKTEKVLAPGEKVALSRKYMTIFCARPEISFSLKNGKIVTKAPKDSKHRDLEALLESYYFVFNDPNLKVNSDEVKVNIGQKKKMPDGTVKWVVKPEFEKTFGYLNNPKVSERKTRAKSSTKFTAQQLAANYINKLLEESGLI